MSPEGRRRAYLYEQGRFSLDDPVSKYLPEFSKMTVAVESTDASGKKVLTIIPAEHAITILDLFRRELSPRRTLLRRFAHNR